MVEAFPAYCYYVRPESPVNGDFSRMLVKKFGSPGDRRRAEIDRVARGEDVLGELNRLGYRESSGHLQAYIAGAMLANYAEETDAIREDFARFVAARASWKAEKGQFDRLFGATPALHAKIAEWWKRKPQ